MSELISLHVHVWGGKGEAKRAYYLVEVFFFFTFAQRLVRSAMMYSSGTEGGI